MNMSPLAQMIDQFLRYLVVEKQRAPNTVSAYQNDLAQFLHFVDQQPADGPPANGALVRPDIVTSFVFALRERGYSPATMARRIAAVKSFFGYAQSVGRISENPAAALDSPRVARPTRKEVSAGEVQALLDGCSGENPEAMRNRAMLTLLYQTGLRVSEVVALDVKDVDLDGGGITTHGRTGKSRTVPLPTAARAAMQLYLSEGWAALHHGSQGSALFLNGRGGRLTRQGFWLIIRTRARRSGVVTAVSPHALRNSFVRDRLESGTAITDLQQLLGHVSISTTRAYARRPNTLERSQPTQA